VNRHLLQHNSSQVRIHEEQRHQAKVQDAIEKANIDHSYDKFMINESMQKLLSKKQGEQFL
jgi:hypothetical protein